MFALAACSVNESAPPPDHGAGGAGGSQVEPQAWTMVTWNVRNLINNTIDDQNAPFEEVDIAYVPHREAVGQVLAPIDADLVVLQEIEHAAVAEELVSQELDGRYPHIAHVDGNDPRGIDVLMLSKLPIDSVVSHRETWFSKEGTTSPDYRFSRDALEVHLTVNGRHVVALGVHFKAKNDDDPDKRLAEAQFTRRIADDLLTADPSALVLIAGDYNDTPASPPWLAVEAQSSPHGAFQAATRDIPPADRYSYTFLGTDELVDHAMLSSDLATMQTGATITHSAEVDTASDHSPVLASFAIR